MLLTEDLFLLIADDLLVLEADQLLLLLKVLYNLPQTLLEHLDLAFEHLDLPLLGLAPLVILVHGSQLQHVSPLCLLVVIL